MINLLISKELGFQTLLKVSERFKTKDIKVLTIDDSRDKRTKLKEISNFCKEKNINICFSSSKRQTHDFLVDNSTNITLVACWYQLIPEKTLVELKKPIIGVHNSLLPKFRGGSPLVWTILTGEDFFGYSVFEITKGMDDGGIYLQEDFKLLSDYDISHCIDTINKSFLSKINFLLSEIILGSQPEKQANDNISYCAQRLPQDGLIDWKKSNSEIHNFIRSQSCPYPGAFSYLNNEKIILEKSQILDENCYGTPGQIFKIDDSGMRIVCNNNTTLLVKKIRVADKFYKPCEYLKTIKHRFKS